jgi:putative transcriptional regulator
MGQSDKNDNSLTGRLLLAMPQMGDPRFHRAVILMCAHDENGAMGLVINNIMPGVDLTELLAQLDIPAPEKADASDDSQPVMNGGPVETARGFVLHSKDFRQAETVDINAEISITGTLDALRAIAAGNGPQKMLFMLGYAGWDAGQLDAEMQQNAWLVAEPDADIVFGAAPDEKWDRAMKKIGVDPAMLSGSAGRA